MTGRLPQYGDAIAASRLLNARMHAGAGASETDMFVTTGTLAIGPDGVSGSGLPSVLAVYGDLFDVHELVIDAGWAGLVFAHQEEIDAGRETVESALIALVLQGVAFGALMERGRWEQKA